MKTTYEHVNALEAALDTFLNLEDVGLLTSKCAVALSEIRSMLNQARREVE